MSRVREAVRGADLRVSLLLVLFGAVMVMLCRSEVSFIALFLVAFLWLCLRGQAVKGLKMAAGYVLLSVLTHFTLGVRGAETFWMLGNLMRHMLIPIAYTAGLTDASTGTLLSVFHRLHLPKSFGISTVVLLRFFPTIGYELSQIRSSLKFRGTGTGFWNTAAHLPANFERTMVPLLIRTTRIAEELSAAAMVRGVRLTNEIKSFDEVRFRRSDAVISGVSGLLALGIFLCDRLLPLEVLL